ncbi:unnamed protein product, partial [Didymodactylos carnosus]
PAPWAKDKNKDNQQNSNDLPLFIRSEMEKLNEKIDNRMNGLGKVIMDFLPAVTALFEMVITTALSQSNDKEETKQQLISDYKEKLKMITQPILVITKSFAERTQQSRDFGINISNCTTISTSTGSIHSSEIMLAPQIIDPAELS